MIANKLKLGDEIRVIAPSSSLSIVREDVYNDALAFLEEYGFKITFSKNSRVIDEFLSSSIKESIPIVFGVDFGHVLPMITFPIGGNVKMDVKGKDVSIEINVH